MDLSVQCCVCDPLLFLFHASWLLFPAHLQYITIETYAPSEWLHCPFIPLHVIPKQRFITNITELLRQITQNAERYVRKRRSSHRQRQSTDPWCICTTIKVWVYVCADNHTGTHIWIQVLCSLTSQCQYQYWQQLCSLISDVTQGHCGEKNWVQYCNQLKI